MSEWLDFFNAYRAPAQHLASVLLAAAIWRWGGGPERWLIAIFLTTMVVPIYAALALGFDTFEHGPLAGAAVMIDGLAAVLFVSVALRANRNYPLWIAAFQVVAVGGHVAKSLIDSASPLAFAILVIGPSYCQLAVLAAGFARHAMRERRYGRYREWRRSAPGLPGLAL